MNKNRKLINAFLVSTMMLSNVAPVAFAASGDAVIQRLGGGTRVETSIDVSNRAYADKADAVVVAGWGGDADALTGTLLASAKDAPLLLVSNKDGDIADVKAEIARLGAKTVYLLGGESVISADLAAEFSDYNVTRVSGDDRFDTAAKVAETVGGEKDHVFLANDGRSGSLADALAAGPVSGDREMPVLLTSKGEVPAVTLDAMKDLGASKVTLVGGESAISAAVVKQLEDAGYTVDRVDGDTRWETAEKIATKYFEDNEKVIIANDGRSTGKTEVYADALMGGYLGAKEYAPILLSVPGKLNDTTKNYLNKNASFAYVLGGETAISDTVYNEVEEILAGKVEEEVDFSVESASAINASEVKVVFSADVDRDDAATFGNYEIKINDKKVGIKNIAVTGNEAVLLLDESFQNGDRYVVQTNNAITSADGEKIEKFASEEIVFNESKAPALNSVDKSGETSLVLNFDRPVSTTTGLIKIDGESIETNELAKVNDHAADYNYVLAVDKKFTKGGKHEIVIYDVKDTAAEYEAKASVLSGEYTVTSEKQVAPEVVSIEALNANKFFIETNQPITELAKAGLVVEKGNHEFVTQSVAINNTVSPAEEDSVYAETGMLNEKPGIFVIVTHGTGENPLYKGKETSADLKVTLENYKAANNLIGEKTVENITLKKNDSKPNVKESDIKGNNLEIVFDGSIEGVNKADIIVRDKDGVIIEDGVSVNVDNDTVKVTLPKVNAAPYTVEFAANKFNYVEYSGSVKGYIVNAAKNDKMLVVVESSEKEDSSYKYIEDAVSTITADSDNNITIKFNKDMSDSARQVENYMLDGKALPAGTRVDFYNDKKTVKVSLPKTSIKTTTKYRFSISTDVTTVNGEHVVGSLQTRDEKYEDIELTDNVRPELSKAVYALANKDDKTTDKILVTFNENVTDASKEGFEVLINGSKQTVSGIEVKKANEVLLTLDTAVNVSQAAKVTIVEGVTVKDIAGNTAKIGSSVEASTAEVSAQ